MCSDALIAAMAVSLVAPESIFDHLGAKPSGEGMDAGMDHIVDLQLRMLIWRSGAVVALLCSGLMVASPVRPGQGALSIGEVWPGDADQQSRTSASVNVTNTPVIEWLDQSV